MDAGTRRAETQITMTWAPRAQVNARTRNSDVPDSPLTEGARLGRDSDDRAIRGPRASEC